ncbi:MAG: alkaline phosphatase PhoX [Methylophilus sp.]
MLKKIALAVALACASQAYAADNTYFDNFTPLAASAGVLPATAPILFSSPNFSQTIISNSLNNGISQYAPTVANAGGDGNAPDMIDADPTGRYIFMPLEQGQGGVLRIDTQDTNYNTRTTVIVTPGSTNAQGFIRGDASRFTPWGGFLTGEENLVGSGTTTASSGRMFEVTNPLTATAGTGNFVQRTVIPRVAHEGIAFDGSKNMYFVDELNGGSVYKYVSANPNATDGNSYFAAGQTFALNVGTGGQNEGTNSILSGSTSWVAITDVNGGAIAGSALLTDGTIDGRASANNLNVTSFNRPEDLELLTLGNGNEAIIFATTDSDNNANSADGRGHVYINNLVTGTLSLFADSNTINLATGLAAGVAFSNPDNIAIDANGNVYIIEDRNGSTDDDIWFANDINHDGDLTDAGEGIARWASNGINGSEFTGLYFSKTNPNLAWVNIQHPNGGNDLTVQIAAVPEPESYAMFLAGLGLMGFAARRNKK